jgi:hypothetical protein
VSQRSSGGNQLVVSYLFLRQAVGWIAILLPFVLLAGNLISATTSPPLSMSGYYYTDMRNAFIGALCALGVFLVAYAGYDDVDRWITNIAGLAAIGVAFCPTKPAVCAAAPAVCPASQVRHLSDSQQVVGDIHLVFAVVAFVMLGLMALRFAKTGPTPSGQDFWAQIRYGLGFGPPGAGQPQVSAADTLIYRISGFTIFTSVLLAALANLLPASVNADWRLLFIFEAVAVVAFGVSWFVKGRTIQGIQARMRKGPAAAKPATAVRTLEDHL